MNLQLVPKYTKYNNCLRQVYLASVNPAKFKSAQTSAPNIYRCSGNKSREPIHEPKLPAPIIVSHYTEKPKHVHIADSRRWGLRRKSTPEPPQPKGICKWYRRKTALRELRKDRKKEKERLKHWEKWRDNEERKVREAQVEKARIEREREFIKQMAAQHRETVRLARDTLKTKYPFPVKQKVTPRIEDEPVEHAILKRPRVLKSAKPAPSQMKPQAEPVAKVKKKKDKIVNTTVVKKKEPKRRSLVGNTRETLSHKFVHCFYKVCCEFYCWISCFLIMGMVVIVVF